MVPADQKKKTEETSTNLVMKLKQKTTLISTKRNLKLNKSWVKYNFN
jgi:hypothetical protein